MTLPKSSATACQWAACLLLGLPGAWGAKAQGSSTPDLSSLDLEQLTRIEVNAASRRDLQLFETPAAVYVITQQEIQQSGATSVPELLRMVPGLEVAQIDADKWAVSARGFNSRFANKMLIMIDERSIYNPVYSGTLWDHNEVMLEDVERIEIVRGPGAAMWGANAVNGVINIVTSKPRDTQGVLVCTVAGRMIESVAARIGFAPADSVKARLFGAYENRPGLRTYDGGSAGDRGWSQRVGGRLDWQRSSRDRVSVEGDIFRTPQMQRIDFGYDPSRFIKDSAYGAGGYAMGRWERQTTWGDWAMQGSWSDGHHKEIGMRLAVQTADLDFQHHLSAGNRNEFVWGGGYRRTSDFVSGRQSYFAHADHIVHLYSAFAQNSLTLVPGRVVLTAGSKFQWNTYTHFEVQPRASLLYTPDGRQALWGAISRAVRTPSDQDHDVHFIYPLGEFNGLPLDGVISGNPALRSEVVIAYEAGYRRRFGKWLSADLAGFVNDYRDLEATMIGSPLLVMNPAPALIQPFQYVNGFTATAQGAEAALAWSPNPALRVMGSYAWMQARFCSRNGATVQPSGGQDWSTPRNTFDVRSTWSLPLHWELTAILNGNSTVPSSLGLPVTVVPGHTRADLRLARRLGEHTTFAAGVTNMTRARHEEFFPEDYTLNSYVPRSIYFGLNWFR